MKKDLVTDYELELLKLLSQGYKRKEITEKMGVTYNKCRKDIKQICEKLKQPNIMCCILLVLFGIDFSRSRSR